MTQNIRHRIETWFEHLAGVFYDHRFKTLLAAGLVMSLLLAQLPKITVDVSTEGFLHEEDPILKAYNRFRDQFGRDELVIVAIESDHIFSFPFLEKLRRLHRDIEDSVPHIEDITSLINARDTRGEGDRLIVEDLLYDWPRSEEDLAALRARVASNPLYQNLMISEDGTLTAIVIQTRTYSTQGQKTDVLEGFADMAAPQTGDGQTVDRPYLTDRENSEVVDGVDRIVANYDAPDFRIRVAGSAAVTHFLKQSMGRDMRRFMLLALLTVAVCLYLMFRRLSGVLLPLLIVVLSLLSTVGLMALFGTPIKLPTQILPSFILAVSVGYSVHILALFYHRFASEGSRRNALVYAVGHSGLAVVMTAATTAAGLFSFSTSEIAPIADLGKFAGAGVLLAMVYTVVLLPALTAFIPMRRKAAGDDMINNGWVDKVLSKIADIDIAHPRIIVAVCIAGICVSVWGAVYIRFSHDPLRWFPADNSVRKATEQIDAHMRGTVALEIVVDTGKENGLYEPDVLNRLLETENFLTDLTVGNVFVGKAWSITTILRETNQALHENRSNFYRIPQDRQLVAQELLLFENSGSDDLEDFTDSQFSKARLMAKVPFVDAIGYDMFLEQVDAHLNQQYPRETAIATGMMALLSRTLTNAIKSMRDSYGYALAVITVMMICLIGRMKIGLLSMIPNLAPILGTLSLLGWFHIPMNLFTMLVGNIAIGLAVDDTIHFMHNFRRYYDQSGDAAWAVRETLHTTGRAMLVTSCVLSVGFYIFMLATMRNLFHFGLLTGTTILLALLADYFVAPALMVLTHPSKKESS